MNDKNPYQQHLMISQLIHAFCIWGCIGMSSIFTRNTCATFHLKVGGYKMRSVFAPLQINYNMQFSQKCTKNDGVNEEKAKHIQHIFDPLISIN